MSKLLLIDDHPIFATSFQHWLQTANEGWDVQVAHTLGAAEALLPEPPMFDLVLLDYDLVGTTGLNVTQRLRELVPALPIAFLSGVTDTHAIQSALANDVMGWIPKALDGNASLAAINLMLCGEKFVPVDLMTDIAALNTNSLLLGLTEMEKAVAKQMVVGAGDKEIAAKLGLEPSTVRNHARSVLRKTGLDNRTKFAVAYERASREPN